MRVVKVLLVIFCLLIVVMYFVPEKHYKQTTHQLAEEANINPKLAKFILHTKVGRKIGYIFIKKSAKKEFRNQVSSGN